VLALAPFTPILLAVLICWVFSVCVHEYAHAIVAYIGGDKSVKSKGYLSFNPLTYLDPITSLLLPLVILIMGGIPLPGGAVRIDVHALPNRHWRAMVSAAGPLSNFLLFLILAFLVHPTTGLVSHASFDKPMWEILLGTMVVLELLSVFFNLIPIPPLDGYGIIEPYLPANIRVFANNLGYWGFFIIFVLFFQLDAPLKWLMDAVDQMFKFLGLPFESTWRCYNIAFFGSSG